jgi:sialate O-acetylesterase
MDAWILAGQSNMQGCGLLRDEALQNADASDPRVWSFSTAGNWELAEEPLHRLWESFTPVHQDFMRAGLTEADREKSNEEIAERERQTRTTGAGLGIAFGKAVADATGQTIGLIPAAHGGTSLEQWSQDLKNEGGASLYGAMLERVRKARATADFNLKGVLWYQGESDCTEGVAATYAERFAAWIEALRADLAMPDLPVYAVQIGCVVVPPCNAQTSWQSRYWEPVREALRIVPERVANTGVVSAVDLGLCDSIHIDTPGLSRLGKRLARLAQHGPKAAPRLRKIEAGEKHPLGFGVARVLCDSMAGGWNPRTHIGGFAVRDAGGAEHPSTCVIAANADARDPKIINVTLSTPLDDSIRLGYGLGLNPYCNATDEADMPLPAFSAQAIK